MISDREMRFVDSVMDGKSPVEAYREHFDCRVLSGAIIAKRAYKLRNDVEIKREIEQRQDMLRAASVKTVADVANEFMRIGFADPGDIVQHRRLCCRYCHGTNHKYQWRDAEEFAHAVRINEETNISRRQMRPPKPKLPAPSDAGGYGFAFNEAPHPQCPSCRGEGQPDLFIVDTTKLTVEQRRLIESIKVNKQGQIEIKFRSQSDALTKAGQMLGGFKQTVILQNPDGSNVSAVPVVTNLTPEEAQERYKQWMNGETKP